jgi:cardiolipin synthase
MERLRLRDALLPPGLLSLARAPLALAFPLALGRPLLALGIIALAGLSDVLDGWWARRSGRTTAAGALLDPVMDKVFVGSVVASLLVEGDLALHEAILIGARDLLELPLVAWLLLDLQALADRQGRVRANALGKVTTVLQFAAVVASLLARPHVGPFALAAGAAGALAAGAYWARVLHVGRARGAPPPFRT